MAEIILKVLTSKKMGNSPELYQAHINIPNTSYLLALVPNSIPEAYFYYDKHEIASDFLRDLSDEFNRAAISGLTEYNAALTGGGAKWPDKYLDWLSGSENISQYRVITAPFRSVDNYVQFLNSLPSEISEITTGTREGIKLAGTKTIDRNGIKRDFYRAITDSSILKPDFKDWIEKLQAGVPTHNIIEP